MPTPAFEDIRSSVKNICTTALSEGDVGSVSYGSIQRELTQLFSYTREDLRPLKSDISAYARSLLNASQPDEPAVGPSTSATSPAPTKSRQKTAESIDPSPSRPSKKRKKAQAIIPSSEAEDEGDEAAQDMDEAVVKSTAKGKGKIANAKGAHKAGPPGGYKSKEFLDSEDNPRSGPIEPPSDEEEPPARAKKPKKSKTVTTEEKPAAVKEKKAKSSSSKKQKRPSDETPNEVEINRLKAFVKACGVRLLSKETEALSEKDTIKHLKSKLADLGMTGRLSMAKAAEIKEKRALDKEMSDLLDTQPRGRVNKVDEDGGRGSRRRAAAESSARAIPKRPIIVGDSDSEEEASAQKLPENESSSDADDDGAEEEGTEEEDFERRQRKLDKQHEKRSKQFAKLVSKSMF